MAKEKVVNIEVLYDGEIATGLEDGSCQTLPEGAVVAVVKSIADSLAAGRKAKIVTKKATVDLAAAPEKIIAAIEKIAAANEVARDELEGGEE